MATGRGKNGRVLRAFTAVMLLPLAALVAQEQPPPPDQGQAPFSQGDPQQGQGAALLAPEQLDGMVAPIALYPDPLVSQVLVASTYPLEVVEAAQWLQQNRNLRGQDLVEAAKGQNWDPSIQALVPFPDVIQRLAQDAQWTTDLGNAFLAQQADVMNAVQRMRQQAQSAGKLQSGPQATVTMEDQDGQEAIQIMPADPQQMYVPDYNPSYFWGDAYDYPNLYYPGVGAGWGFGYPVSAGLYFGGGWGGWGGWGWSPNWFGRSVYVNNVFFQRYRFNRDRHDYGAGRHQWMHDPGHRQAVPYSNRVVAQQYHGTVSTGYRTVPSAQYRSGQVPAGTRYGAGYNGGYNAAPPQRTYGYGTQRNPSFQNRQTVPYTPPVQNNRGYIAPRGGDAPRGGGQPTRGQSSQPAARPTGGGSTGGRPSGGFSGGGSHPTGGNGGGGHASGGGGNSHR